MTLEEIDQQLAASGARISRLESVSDPTSWWSVTNAMTISVVVLLYGLIVVACAVYLLRINKSSESVLRVFGTIMIVTAAVFLVVAGYTERQISPVMGLLGTVAGYLLGRGAQEHA